jgi:predicted cobalt transporter CbtA
MVSLIAIHSILAHRIFIMRHSGWVFILTSMATAMPHLSGHTNPERFIIELSSGEMQEVTEADKFSLKRVCTYHMRHDL